MNPNTQARFKKASHQLLSGNYTNTFTRWRQIAHDFKHPSDLLLGLIKEVMCERAEQPLEVDVAFQEEYESYFEILKAWVIYDNYDLAISYFEQLIAEANQRVASGEHVTVIQANAMNNRAYMHQHGQGEVNGRPNDAAAIALYDLAIDADDAGAMYNRACIHQHGQGEANGRPNDAAAIALYDRAILLGNTSAMVKRAYMQMNGQGEPNGRLNSVAAILLFDRAIALDSNSIAMFSRRSMESLREGDNKTDVLRLMNLMWCDLLENKPLTRATQKLLGSYSQLIATKLMTIIDIELLNRVVSDDHVIFTLLRSEKSPGFLSIFITQKASSLQQVQDHIESLENPRASEVASSEEEDNDSCDEDGVELQSLLRCRRY